MEVIPAIDLREGRVVRLHQGDYGKQTVYATDPVAVAQAFEAAGAPRLHVVDLDGALEGAPRNTHVYEGIARSVRIPFQVGGGLRTFNAANEALAMGADRVVLGTAAVADSDLVDRVVAKHGAQRVVVGLDTRDGLVAIKGWTEGTPLSATELMTRAAARGIGHFVYTDIARDGTMTEPNFDAVAAMVHHARGLAVGGDWTGALSLTVAGGISTIAHLERLAGLGSASAIVGSAIYTGAIDLAEAVAALRDR